MYLSGSAFSANLSPPNKPSFKVKSEFKYRDHVPHSKIIKKFILFGELKAVFFCFKQLHLNIKQKFEFLYHLIDGERLLPVVVEAVRFSAD